MRIVLRVRNADLRIVGCVAFLLVLFSMTHAAGQLASIQSPIPLNTNAASDGINDTDSGISITITGPGEFAAIHATWGDPVLMSLNALAANAVDVLPKIASVGSGNWVVLWESTDNLGNTIGNDFDILFTQFTIPGTLDPAFVDFAHTGTETGSEAQPFDTLAEGIAALADGGTIMIQPGSSPETATIAQAMTLRNATGIQPVSIGAAAP